MTPIEFCYWLQGALELGGNKSFSEEQVKVLNDHLNLVFKKVTSTPKTGPVFSGPATMPLDGIRTTPWVGPYLPPMTNTLPCDTAPRFTPQNKALSDAISQASARETIVADLKKGTLSLQC